MNNASDMKNACFSNCKTCKNKKVCGEGGYYLNNEEYIPLEDLSKGLNAIPAKEKLSEGVKYDEGKNRMELIPPEVIEELGKVLTHGAAKYDDDNYLKLSPKRYVGALLRHFNDRRKGIKIDPDSGFRLASLVLCNAAILLMLEIKKEEKLKD